LAEREPLQYADFADWQRTVFNPASNTYRGAVQWWREYLGGAPRTLVPPCRRLWRIKGLNPDQGYLRWGVTPELSARLHEIGRKQKATFFVVRLAAFVAFLAAATRQRDIVFGTYVSNRTHFATQGMMGFFVNLAILRYRYDESRAFSEFLSSVSADFGTAAAQCGIPYDDLRHALAQEGQPAPHIQIIFTTTRRRNFPEDLDIGISKLDRRMVGMPWSFSINFDENDETSDCRVNFDAGIYAPPRVRSFVGEFCAFLDAVSLHPDLPLAQVAAMSPLSEPSIGSRIYEFLFRLFR
jgi:non-ribosomal peptide synthetase component F